MLETFLATLALLPVAIALCGPAALDYRRRRRAGETHRASARVTWVLLALAAPLAVAHAVFPTPTTMAFALAVFAWGLMGAFLLVLALATVTSVVAEHVTGIGEGEVGSALVTTVGFVAGIAAPLAALIGLGGWTTPGTAVATFVITGLWFQAVLRLFEATGPDAS